MMEWRENDYYWYWFVNIKSIGHKTRKLLLKEFGHPRHVYHGERRKIMALLQEKQREYFFASQNRDEINTSVKRLRDGRSLFTGNQNSIRKNSGNCTIRLMACIFAAGCRIRTDRYWAWLVPDWERNMVCRQPEVLPALW